MQHLGPSLHTGKRASSKFMISLLYWERAGKYHRERSKIRVVASCELPSLCHEETRIDYRDKNEHGGLVDGPLHVPLYCPPVVKSLLPLVLACSAVDHRKFWNGGNLSDPLSVGAHNSVRRDSCCDMGTMQTKPLPVPEPHLQSHAGLVNVRCKKIE